MYAFEDLSEERFEDLIVEICRNVLGISAHKFTSGPDGGRDSSFSGTASNYPNEKNPWKGNFIIQAKHVKNPEESCSDKKFFGNKSSVVNTEVAKIKQHQTKEHIDCYLIFTNRKLSGGIHPKIKQYITNELGIENVDIHGVEDLNNIVDKYPEITRRFNLNYLLSGRFYEKDIRDVIVRFSENIDWKYTLPNDDKEKFYYLDKEEKNKLNDIQYAYFEDIKTNSLKYFKDINDFLTNPQNGQYTKMYMNTVSDLRGYVLRNSSSYTFVQLLEAIIENIVGNDDTQDIHKVRMLVRIFVHFMYWNCDIGKKE